MKNVALITGASSGIGREFARIHAEKGSDLIIIARREERLLELKDELEQSHQVRVHVLAKDLTNPQAPREIYDAIETEEIEIDYLINNAGIGGLGKFHEREWSKDLAMIQLNIVALTALTRFFLPSFVRRDAGKILNVSSTASLLPGPLQAVYYATKAYVTSFSNAIFEELSETNVTVTALLPGVTDTEFASASDLEETSLFSRAVSPRSVAEDGYEAMINGDLEVISGLTFSQSLMVKAIPLTPKKMLMKQVRKMQEVS